MAAASRYLYLLSVIGLSFSEVNQTDDSWGKLEISPRAIASMPFNNYRINIYEHSGGLKNIDAKNKKYFYAPISLLDPQSAVGEFNNATGEAEVRFRVYLWNESVEKEILHYLNKFVSTEISIHQVHVIPFEKVILSTTEQTANYRVRKDWIPYQSDQYLEFRFVCDALKVCTNLAEQMRYNPHQFAHLKLQFSLDSLRSKRRETIIRVENIVSGSLFSQLKQKLPNREEVYLTADDTKRFVSETVSNVITETFSDDEILHKGAESTIYNLLEKFLISGKEEINEQRSTMWDSVFWDNDNYRPDRSSRAITEVYRNSEHEAKQRMEETFSTSNKISVDLEEIFGSFDFNAGFTSERSGSNRKEKEDFLKLMKESKDHVYWEGEKFVPKRMQLSRVNLAKVSNTQNFRDIKTQVIYTQSVLSTAVKTSVYSNVQSLGPFVTESKLNDAIAELNLTIARLENNATSQLLVRVADLEKKIETRNKRVAFFVGRHSSFHNPDSIITYEDIHLNEGNAVDIHTGIFSVPVNGVYFISFTAELVVHTNKDIFNYVRLFVNSNIIKALAAVNTPVRRTSVTTGFSVILKLEVGDKVAVKLYNTDGLYDDDWPHTLFVGYLLHET